MTIPHALLALLATEPKFGLRLKEEFEAHTGSVWPLNVGQVYATLQRLERDGFIMTASSDFEAPSQKLYTLTNSGASELHHWLFTPPGNDVPPRDEIVIKVMVALTVPNIDVSGVLQSHRARVLETMQSFQRIKRNGLDDLALTLVADAELFRLEASVRWLDSCETRLRRGDKLTKTKVTTTKITNTQNSNQPPANAKTTKASVRQ
jgi:DNA-binding PadR family transcriptional regulator